MEKPAVLGPICRIEELRRATVVRVVGEVDLTNVSTLWDVLLGAIRPRRAVVVDLGRLRYVDSVGLHMLLRAAQRADGVQGELVFAAPVEIRHLMGSVGLDRLVRVLPDVETALRTVKTTA